jgi:hypothetical protein
VTSFRREDFLCQLLAIAAVRVFEGDQHVLSVAAHLLQRESKRQRVELALGSEVLARLHVQHVAEQQVVGLVVGVEDLAIHRDFPDAGHGRLDDLLDLAQLGLDGFPYIGLVGKAARETQARAAANRGDFMGSPVGFRLPVRSGPAGPLRPARHW